MHFCVEHLRHLDGRRASLGSRVFASFLRILAALALNLTCVFAVSALRRVVFARGMFLAVGAFGRAGVVRFIALLFGLVGLGSALLLAAIARRILWTNIIYSIYIYVYICIHTHT